MACFTLFTFFTLQECVFLYLFFFFVIQSTIDFQIIVYSHPSPKELLSHDNIFIVSFFDKNDVLFYSMKNSYFNKLHISSTYIDLSKLQTFFFYSSPNDVIIDFFKEKHQCEIGTSFRNIHALTRG